MLTIGDIGINLDTPGPATTLARTEVELARLAALGFRLVEIGVSPFAVIVNGEIRQKQLSGLCSVLSGAGLRYSLHGIGRLNLAFDPRHELARSIMRAQIGFCRAIGATRLVYHSGLQALDGVAKGTRRTLLSDEELAEGARREVAAFKDLARVAADSGVVICMENLDPHLWEHALIERFGLPREDITKHLARLRIGPIVRQLEAIDHPNVGMTLDVAHLYMAAQDLGFDYLEEIRLAAPWARHLHVNDNFGKLDVGSDGWDRWAFGEADLHMPPGWGRVPYADVFRLLPDYTGDLILEVEPGFEDAYPEALETTRAILRSLS